MLESETKLLTLISKKPIWEICYTKIAKLLNFLTKKQSMYWIMIANTNKDLEIVPNSPNIIIKFINSLILTVDKQEDTSNLGMLNLVPQWIWNLKLCHLPEDLDIRSENPFIFMISEPKLLIMVLLKKSYLLMKPIP